MRNLLLITLVAGWAVAAPFSRSGVAVASCGNGIVEAGENCDDGADNGSASSCCDASCHFKPDGNASCDGNVCTRPDTCTGGVCSPGNCADGSACTVCGGQCIDGGSSCDCDFPQPTPTPFVCPAGGVAVDGACWFFGPVSASCDQVCGGLGLSYDSATRTFAGSDGSFASCTAVKDAINSAGKGSCDPLPIGDQNCSALGSNPGIGCHCAPDFGFLVALTRCIAPPTTSNAAVVNRARYCACQ
jgi:hypothetical protein